MVEKSHTAGLWPAFYEPFRHFGTRVAEFLSPASDAKADDKRYRISLELPGVEEKDIDRMGFQVGQSFKGIFEGTRQR